MIKEIIKEVITPQLIVRLLLTIVLLVLVWRNAHWSVALLLTLQTIGMELLGMSLELQRKMIRGVK